MSFWSQLVISMATAGMQGNKVKAVGLVHEVNAVIAGPNEGDGDDLVTWFGYRG